MSIARALPHDSARLHVTGAARYVDDIPVPNGTLSLAFGLSEIAHGRIKALDLDPVRTTNGVAAVLTADDLPFANDVSPSVNDEPLLAVGEVFYVGQPVVLVAADSHLSARVAARKAEIEYEELPAILTIDDALTADSRFEDGPLIWEKGDARSAIASAEHVVRGTLELGGQEHFYLEGQAALALPQEDGGMVVHCSSQHPTEIQHKVAEALGVPMHSVRVEVRRMGGGFGGKESQGNALACACAIAARLTGRPCKIRYDRDDDMTITGKRHDFRIHYHAGCGDDGRIKGVEFIHYSRCGWSQDLSLPVADRAMLQCDNAYHLPTARIESHRLRTNTQSATAFRGFGGPQGTIGMERVIDHIAHELGFDPLEIRTLNYYPEQDTRRAPRTTHYRMPVEDFALHAITEELETSSDYRKRRAAVADWNATNSTLKKGIALTPVKFGISFTLTHLNQAGALVHVYRDGSIHMNHGGTEMGQGLFQKVAQVAAGRFGVPLEAVRVTPADTGKVPNTSATAASSGTDLNGMAVMRACDTIRDRMAEYLAMEHQAPITDVRFVGGNVVVGAAIYSFADVARKCHEGRISLSATGFYRTPKLEWNRLQGKGRPFHYFAYGAAVTEVVLDTLTGENRILRTDILHDAGTSLNPAIDIGQVEGGFVQGAGWLTMEELVWDDGGRLRTHAPSTYKIPACSDRPQVFNVSLWKRGRNREDTVHRSKAVGEPPLLLGISTFLALSDAVAACGRSYPALDAPATPERLLAAVRRVQVTKP